MDEVEAGALRSSARAALASASPVLPLAAVDPRAVDGLATELGWTDLGGDLRALVIVAEELGRAGSDWPVHETFADGDDVLHALALVARAIGAARAGHELAVQHAIDRVQFGQPIGAFQAVSHRLADAAVELAGWDAVVGSIDAGDPVALLAAVVHGRAAALRALGAAQRTLGAMGYFDEHALPWLFRRVHADLDEQRSLVWAEHRLGDALLTHGRPNGLALGPEADAIVERLTADLAAITFDPSPTLDDDAAVVEALGARGWIAPGLPVDVGGLGLSLVEQMAVDVELQRRQVPVRVARGVAATLAGVIDAFGSDEQRAEFLPRIATGRFHGYLGYSEPDVGSDLASLRTKAVRDGDEWVVDGTKMWGTGAHRADHVWLAARTGGPGRDGITVFLAPTDLPGWSRTEHHALSGEVACTTVFDGVRIPDRCRVGEVDGGWPIIMSALAAERVVMAGLAGEVGRQLDELIATCRDRNGEVVRVTVAELAARQAVAESLLVASTRAAGELQGFMDAAMAKLVTSELAELVARKAHDLLGTAASTGTFDQAIRLAPMYVIGGGTADIQRNLIARSLGLPKSG